MGFSLTAFQARIYEDYLAAHDGPDEIECPIEVITPKGDGYNFRDKETGRFVSASEAVEIMESVGYTGSWLDDAEDIAKDQREAK